MGQIREPIKKSSIEKKNKIIEKGFELMCTKGYHNVTCVDIAKYAGVSTGIIYQYFKDKRDIFIPESYKLCIHTALRRTPNPLSIYSRAALPFGKTALFVMKMKKPNYLAFMAAL